jgi:hypothetical protein
LVLLFYWGFATISQILQFHQEISNTLLLIHNKLPSQIRDNIPVLAGVVTVLLVSFYL